ncbi:MAG: ATP-binding protein [Spirochaetia bacterium]|nr:ATP-binding protein [Spirochaetia bacterium]
MLQQKIDSENNFHSVQEDLRRFPPVWNSVNDKITEYLKFLGKLGCSGECDDFRSWLSASGIYVDDMKHLKEHLENLVLQGTFERSGEAKTVYRYKDVCFPSEIEYSLSSHFETAPISFVRSRIDSYLSFNNCSDELKTDILIGVVEAVENAVKYNGSDHFYVHYWTESENLFNLEICNQVPAVSIEDDIQSGKFTGAKTLMRGVLIMESTFDFFDLDLSPDGKIAVMKANKKFR